MSSRPLRLPQALLGLALLLAVGPVRGDDALPRAAGQPVEGVAPACEGCHPRQTREWLHSVHASVKRTLPLPERVDGRRPFEAPECVACHGDDLSRIAGLGARSREHPVVLSHHTETTITCQVCHQIPEPFEGLPGPITSGDPDGEEGRYRKQFHRARLLSEMPPDQLCGPCHQVKTPSGLEIERTHSQYLASAYPGRNISCSDCHMTSHGGSIIPGGFFREQVHRHDILGADTSVHAVPEAGSQLVRVRKFLAAAATLFVKAPPRARAGDTLPVTIELVNSGAGHHLPAGFPGERRLWLEVEVRDSGGELLLSRGVSQRPQQQIRSLESPVPPENQDDPRLVFHDRYLGEDGREVEFWWEARRIETRSIPALDRRRLELELPLEADWLGRKLRVSVKLRFQACSPRALARQGLSELVADHPVLDLHERVIEGIEVVERVLPADLVRVPEDIRDLQEAIDRVPPGGEISVAPGDYGLERALDFRGKALTLRGREGAESTVLRREFSRGEGVPDDGSLLQFTSGEGADTRVEHLTLSRGRGTRIEGTRRGGAIFVRGASPTLLHLEIVDSRADLGGGVYLEDSSAHLERNRIERNRAVQGGGLFLRESPDAFLRGNLVHANRADEEGGGLRVEGGLVLVESLVQANIAGRGGGLSLSGADDAADDGAPRLLSVWVQGNSAVLGGGIEIDDVAASLERVVVAGNAARLGGGLYLQGEASSELVNLTVVENRATSRGTLRVKGPGQPRIRNSILFNNSDAELAGEITYSLVQDPEFQGGSNQGGFPLFTSPGEWLPCEFQGEPGCVPVRWDRSRPPAVVARARFRPGVYTQILGSVTIDAGDPRDSAEKDGSQRDQGAIARLRPAKGFIRGDVDGDAELSYLDVRDLLRAVHPESSPDALARMTCADAADFDDDGRVDLGDAYLLAACIFEAGRVPAPPFPDCGVDLTPDDGLGCYRGSAACP